jgi:hypothetical protein
MARNFGKKNVVKIDPLAYNICLLGEPKIGKTTIIKEMLETLVGEDGYIFLEMAGEAGADAINDIVYEDCNSWEDLEEIVEDIEDNRNTDYEKLKVLAIDTYDGWITLAEQEALRLWNKSNPDKKTDSLEASWGGFQKGQTKAFKLMFDIFTRLKNVGISPLIIGHVKNKELTDIATGTTYQTLTSDVEKIYFNLLKKKMHFLCLAYYDRTIITEKTGKKNLVTKKDITVNKIAGESRKIKFRDDNMALDSGSRFADIVEEIDFSADELIKAFTDAIKVEHSKSGKSIEETKEEQEKESKELVAKNVAKNKEKSENEELKNIVLEISDFIKANKNTTSVLKPLLIKSKEFGLTNPSKVQDINQARELLALITSESDEDTEDEE